MLGRADAMEPSDTISIDSEAQPTLHAAAPCLFLLLECERPTAGSSRHSLGGLDEVVIGRGDTRSVSRAAARLHVCVPDASMSSQHARIVREGRRLVIEDAGSKNGTWVNGARQMRAFLSDGDLIAAGGTFFIYRETLAQSAQPDLVTTYDGDEGGGLVSLLPSLRLQLDDLKAVARSTVPVLVLGESGTGKELTARAVHRLSGRSGDLVSVSCGAIARSLIESELFGYRKGAFSGANEDRDGLIRCADGGTLFLDEIADLPESGQAALLRVLQEREVLPVGATRPVPIDLRVVAATHRDLGSTGFRADLLSRLRGFEVRLWPLRRRREDFGVILAAICQRISRASGVAVRFTPAALGAILSHDWPFNIRQLEQCVTACATLSAGRIEHRHLAAHVLIKQPSRSTGLEPTLTEEDRQRRAQLIASLQAHGGNLSEVARALGKERLQIRRWLKRYGIDVDGNPKPETGENSD